MTIKEVTCDGRPIQWDRCPVPRMVDTIKRYVQHGVQPGHFVTAILTNNLSQSVSRADEENAAHLVEWVRFLHNYLPTDCHGSIEIVNAWRDERNTSRLEEVEA